MCEPQWLISKAVARETDKEVMRMDGRRLGTDRGGHWEKERGHVWIMQSVSGT